MVADRLSNNIADVLGRLFHKVLWRLNIFAFEEEATLTARGNGTFILSVRFEPVSLDDVVIVSPFIDLVRGWAIAKNLSLIARKKRGNPVKGFKGVSEHFSWLHYGF